MRRTFSVSCPPFHNRRNREAYQPGGSMFSMYDISSLIIESSSPNKASQAACKFICLLWTEKDKGGDEAFGIFKPALPRRMAWEIEHGTFWPITRWRSISSSFNNLSDSSSASFLTGIPSRKKQCGLYVGDHSLVRAAFCHFFFSSSSLA